MNKRKRIFIICIFILSLIIAALTAFAKYKLEQFNHTYLKEEIEEVEVLANQIGWAVKPYLKDKNYAELEKFSNTFKNSDTSISIKNSKGVVVAGYKNPLDCTFEGEKTFIRNDVVYHIKPIFIGKEKYNLLVFTTTQDVNKTLTRLDKFILISVIVGIFIIFFIGIYLLRLYQAFNRLQNSAVKISAGNLEANLFIPNGGILHELACALDKMSKRFKLQIEEMQKLERFRNEFIANISHELKTPLTAILSAVETIEDMNLINSDLERCFEIIKKQSGRINSLVQDILNIHELEMRNIEDKTNFVSFNLAKIIEESISLSDTSNIIINLDLENVLIKCDCALLEQAIINILTNAIRYSKSEKIDITLTKINDTAKICIKDYGVGIPQEHLAYIFDYFYRVDKARSRNLGGTGLGLAIVKKIINLHDGTIEVISENGCEFIITLPL